MGGISVISLFPKCRSPNSPLVMALSPMRMSWGVGGACPLLPLLHHLNTVKQAKPHPYKIKCSFIMKLEMEAPPLPPSFPFPSCLPFSSPPCPFPREGNLGSTEPRPRAGRPRARLTAGQSSREVAAAVRAGAQALGSWAGSLSLCWRLRSQDEAMSDGWNHAGRSVRTGAGHQSPNGGQGKSCPPPPPKSGSRATDLGQSIPCRRVGSSGWMFPLFFFLWG